jgi:methyl-accepting chemotaxis protein
MNTSTLNDQVENYSADGAVEFPAIGQTESNTSSATGTMVNNAVNESNSGEDSNGLQETTGQSEGLSQINALLENITSQANLLSLNASIEAFQVGETRKTFALLASNIRKHTESSQDLSGTINEALKNMRCSINKINQSTKAILGKFESVGLSVEIPAEQDENNRSACEEQGSDTGDAVIQENTSPEESTKEINVGVEKLSAGMDQLNAVVSNIDKLCAKTHESIAALAREASQFKV